MSQKLEIHRDFKECIESLPSHGVEFVVIGGYAVAAHGRPRYTGDIDIPFISLTDLIANKRATARGKDLIDLGLLKDPSSNP
jgi:predicted nucleotidyltransferase